MSGKHMRSVPAINKTYKVKATASAHFQILGTGAADTRPSILLSTDNQKYIFGCGEATQKLFNENKVRLGKIKDIFLTQTTWDYIGGLPGLLLTLRDTGRTIPINIHGPGNLQRIFMSMKPFLNLQHMNTHLTEYSEKNIEKYEDESMTIWPIYTQGKEEESFSYNSEIIKIKENVDQDFDGVLGHTNNEVCTKPSKKWRADITPAGAVSYICEFHSLPGKLDTKKAIELGVPKGPMFGQLKEGTTLTLKNGKVVKPEDVMAPSHSGIVFCIIDCPDKYYFDHLITNPILKKHQMNGSKAPTSVIIHLSPSSMVHTPEYINWTTRFGKDCQHLFLNEDMCSAKTVLYSQLKIQYKLNKIKPSLFPRLYTSYKTKTKIDEAMNPNWKAGESFLIYHLRPAQKIGYDRSEIEAKWTKIYNYIENDLKEGQTSKDCFQDFLDPTKYLLARQESRNHSEYSIHNDMKGKNFEIVFLGTGAALPSKYRNVSSTLINISKDKVMLLDCGEGTYGQLYRHYGPETKDILLKLCCVFISHIHADHHLGLIRLLQERQTHIEQLPTNQQPDSTLVVGPPSILNWLNNYGIFHGTLHLRFLDSVDYQNSQMIGNEILSSILECEKVTVVPVIHCPDAFGLVLLHNNGWKLVYSGDTRPCSELIKRGKGADILIHEATFEDNLPEEAIAKSHCTTTEAIKCGQEMQATYIILNHFSQRYPKIPAFSEQFNKCTGIAFDHMTVNFQSIQILPELIQPLQDVFKEPEEIEVEKQIDEGIDRENSEKTAVAMKENKGSTRAITTVGTDKENPEV